MRALFGHNITNAKLVFNKFIKTDEFQFYHQPNQKFTEDKIFVETSDFVFGLDGAILNKKDLTQSTWANYFTDDLSQIKQKINALRGVYSGFIYNKKSKKLELFNDPTGTKNFSIYHHNNIFVFASTAIDLIELLKQLKVEIKVNPEAMYSFLSYGFLLSSLSWVKHSYRLKPGSILAFLSNKSIITSYKTFGVNPQNSWSRKKVMNQFEELMRNAVNLQFSKDETEGYQHIVTLSGGLDSRSTALLAYDLGYKKQIAFCCSQKNYADETIARKIAKNYNFDFQFHALDELEHFYNTENTLEKIGGTAHYTGPSHVICGLEKIWKPQFGIIHSGQLGDGIMGGFLTEKKEKKPNALFGRVSKNLLPIDFEFNQKYIDSYNNEDEFKLYERGFSGAASGVWGLEHMSYNISPFTDDDVLDFSMKIPYDYKYKRLIYLEWMIKHHPNWTKYKWESIHTKPNALWKLKYDSQLLRIRFGLKKLLYKDFRLKFKMSPEQYWYNNSIELQSYYQQSFLELFESLKEHDIPYLEVLQKYTQSNQTKLISFALSALIILEKIYLQKT